MLKKHRQLLQDEKKILAPYAMSSVQSAGRVHPEEEDPFRLPFQRDRDRIIHSKAFRRLQAKTQVFIATFGDHYRDRMTHSLEVAQIARDVSRTLGLNEDLSECLALAHDLGHPPFGHGGQDALNEIMENYGLHFEHNEQSRRILEKLEKIHPDFDGLNVSKEVLDGLLKHHPHRYHTYLKFETAAHLEGQLVDIADEIAYINHDIDDGLRAGAITVKQLDKFAIWNIAVEEVYKKFGRKKRPQNREVQKIFSRLTVSNLIKQMIHDLHTQTALNLKQNHIRSIENVRSFKGQLVNFSKPMRLKINDLRVFLMKYFYFNPLVLNDIKKGKAILKKLFLYYTRNPQKLPEPFLKAIKASERPEIVIKDYIAGMTDHYAIEKLHEFKLKE